MKSIRGIVVYVLVFLLCTGVCFAEQGGTLEERLRQSDAAAAQEKLQVEQVLEQSSASMEQTIRETQAEELPSSEQTLGEFEMQQAYRVRSFRDGQAVEHYQRTGSIEENLSEEYQWKVPTSTGYLVTVSRQQGADSWQVTGFSDERSVETQAVDSGALSAMTDAHRLNSIVQAAQLSEIERVEYIDAIRYARTTFVYVRGSGEEYLIPYSLRPDLTGLENGKLYPAAEAMELLAAAFPSQNTSSIGEAVFGGAAGFQEQEEPGPAGLVWLAVGLAAAAFAGAAIWMVRRRRVKK